MSSYCLYRYINFGYVYMYTVILTLEIMIFGQGHDTLLGHGQQLCENLSRSNMEMKSYGPDTNFVGTDEIRL